MEQKKIDLVQRKNFSSSELIELLASHDTLVKKLTCDYLIDKASIDGDVILLAANVLLRDCGDANPCVRSASLRALCSLPNLGGEAGVASVTKAMADASPQVRRSVPGCCVALLRDCGGTPVGGGLVDLLYGGVRDPDPLVVTSCLVALEVVLGPEGGLVVNRKMGLHLASKLGSFPPCGAVYVLTLLGKFLPQREDDLFRALNDLDPCLHSPVTPVLAAALRLFMTWTGPRFPHLWGDVCHTVEAPVTKTLSQSRPETCFRFLGFLLDAAPAPLLPLLRDQFRYFLPRARDPPYLRAEKLRLLPHVTGPDNARDVIAEVKLYTSDYQSFREAFRCLGALSAPEKGAEGAVVALLAGALGDAASDQVAEAALETLLHIVLRSKGKLDLSPDLCHGVTRAMGRPGIQGQNPDLVLRTVQLLCPVLEGLQGIFEDFATHADPTSGGTLKRDSYGGTSGAGSPPWGPQTRCLFLSAACLAFLHQPAAMQPLLPAVWSKALRDPHPAVVKRAAFLYAALEEGQTDALKLLSVVSVTNA